MLMSPLDFLMQNGRKEKASRKGFVCVCVCLCVYAHMGNWKDAEWVDQWVERE